MEQKKFMDIERLKENNCSGFEKGDIIQISEKIDNSNASIRYDVETGSLIAFSRKQTLGFKNTLSGFLGYVQSLNADDYKDTPSYTIFGEWSGAKNAIVYNEDQKNKWYVYDIYDNDKCVYLPQTEVKAFVEKHNLTYVHVLYEGEFISWEHCMTFCHSPAYGDVQEGIVCKNQSKLNDPNGRNPFYLKVVNESFAEIKKDNHRIKIADPQKIKARETAMELMESIVTKRRVEKELYKMRDEGILPDEWQDKDMAIVSRTLPRRIYDDCMKEEKDTMIAAGEYSGKFCGNLSMKYAREIIVGA